RLLPLPENSRQAAQEDEHQGRGQPSNERLAPAPADHAFPVTDGPSKDRLARAEAAQNVGEFLGRGGAPAWPLAPTLQANGVEIARNGGLKEPRSYRLVVLYLQHSQRGSLRPERRPAGQRFI